MPAGQVGRPGKPGALAADPAQPDGGATDAALLDKANVILGRLKNGETFEVLAREFSEDQRRDRAETGLARSY